VTRFSRGEAKPNVIDWVLWLLFTGAVAAVFADAVSELDAARAATVLTGLFGGATIFGTGQLIRLTQARQVGQIQKYPSEEAVEARENTSTALRRRPPTEMGQERLVPPAQRRRDWELFVGVLIVAMCGYTAHRAKRQFRERPR
jgi:hypothetical protein